MKQGQIWLSVFKYIFHTKHGFFCIEIYTNYVRHVNFTYSPAPALSESDPALVVGEHDCFGPFSSYMPFCALDDDFSDS